jgi:hypothetical protein
MLDLAGTFERVRVDMRSGRHFRRRAILDDAAFSTVPICAKSSRMSERTFLRALN